MNKRHKWHKEIKAWADGAEIEYQDEFGEWELWKNVNSPSWLEIDEYRIKPQPKQNKNGWSEEVMKQWDKVRKMIANGDTSSYPRDWFESLAETEPQPQPKEPRYLYVYIGENDRYIFSMFHPSKYSNPECIGKIKLEVEEDV